MLVKSYYNCFLLVKKLSLFLDNNCTTTVYVVEKVLQERIDKKATYYVYCNEKYKRHSKQSLQMHREVTGSQSNLEIFSHLTTIQMPASLVVTYKK